VIKELLNIANELDKRGLHNEASVIDLCIEKQAVPREMSEELKNSLSEADEVNISEPEEVSWKSNYLGISDRIGPMPDLGNRIPRIIMSKGPIERIPNTPQPIRSKPDGLWYACGNEWLDWLKYEMPHWIGKYIYAIELNEDKILKITNVQEFEEFERAYRASEKDDPSRMHGFGGGGGDISYIDWPKVAKEYGGVEICPYMSSKREVDWYYPWDVASGCIWSSGVVKSLKLVSQATGKQGDLRPSEDDPEDWDWRGWEREESND
jgi:hypothetical protein